MTMKNKWIFLTVGCFIMALLFFARCSKKKTKVEVFDNMTIEEVIDHNELRKMEGMPVPLESPEKENDIKSIVEQWTPNTIYFDFDKWVLNGSSLEDLGNLCEEMHKKSESKLFVAGHCDERGSYEYNLALGQHRAESAKRYLIHCGIDESRIETISYGEEQTISPRHDMNRRDEFKIK